MDSINTEDIKDEHNFKTKQDYRGREDLQKTINTIYYIKKDNQVKQHHHEDIDKNFIRSLKKLYTHTILLLLTALMISSRIRR